MRLKRLDKRNFVCLSIIIISLLFSIFYFKHAHIRLFETFKDLWTSCVYYVSELFDLNLKVSPSINDFSKTPFVMPFNLPNTWEEFKVLINNYWNLLFTKDNFKAYLSALSIFLTNVSRFIILVIPFVMLFKIISSNSEQNNNYNQDTKALSWWKRNIEQKIYYPLRTKIISFILFIREHDYYYKIFLLIWAYNFNLISIFIAFIAYYFYFVVSFSLVSIYTQSIKLLLDLSVIIDFVPLIIWLIFFYFVFDKICRNRAYQKLEHMEMKNRGFINERPIVLLVCGTMGSNKTTTITDIALSQEIMFRDKAFEKILECDLKFPNFPWINLENTLKHCINNHIIYNLATCKRFIQHLRFCYENRSNPELAKRLKKRLKKKFNIDYDNFLFGYDLTKNPCLYNDGLKIIDIWDTIEIYAQLYFVYIIESSLIVSNYSIRTDNQLSDLGNFPMWNTDLFKQDPRFAAAFSRHAHILDFDSLRLGKKVIEHNEKSDAFEFGIINITEIGKERGNNLELQTIKKNDDKANQKNDLFNSWLKMVRHSATIDNFPFVKIISDEQRPESWGADARELAEVVYIDEKSEKRLTLPLFTIREMILNKVISNFKSKYYMYRYERADNTLKMYLYHNLISKFNSYLSKIYNVFGYYKLDVSIQSGKLDSEFKQSNYYLMFKKIYSKRFSTDCFSDYFNEKAFRSKLGINDIPEFQTEKASFEEMMQENSYFFNDLINMKKRKN